MGYAGGTRVIPAVLIRGRQERQGWTKGIAVKAEVIYSEDRGRPHKPRNSGNPWKLEKAREWILPWSF